MGKRSKDGISECQVSNKKKASWPKKAGPEKVSGTSSITAPTLEKGEEPTARKPEE